MASVPAVLTGWARQRFPVLRELRVTLMRTLSIATMIEQLAPLFERQLAPRLESLMISLGTADVARAMTAAIDASPLRAQLRELRVS